MYIVYFLNPTTCVFSYKENRQAAPASPTVHNTTCVFSYKETLNKNFRIHYTTTTPVFIYLALFPLLNMQLHYSNSRSYLRLVRKFFIRKYGSKITSAG